MTIFAAAISAAACADFERGDPLASAPDALGDAGPPPDGGTSDASSAARSFARDVHPLLLEGCARCHSPNGQADDTALVLLNHPAGDRDAVLGLVNRDSPAASRLLSKGAGTGHGGGAIYTAGTPEYQTILEWITQGTAP